LVIDVQENIQEFQNQLMLPNKANNHEQLMSKKIFIFKNNNNQ
jgi:hypothetical protein